MVYGPRQTDLKLENAEFDAGETRSKLRALPGNQNEASYKPTPCRYLVEEMKLKKKGRILQKEMIFFCCGDGFMRIANGKKSLELIAFDSEVDQACKS